MPHTGWFDVLDFRINGISVGEFGTFAFLALGYGVTPFFGAGDAAFCKEARALCPGIRAVAVKEGFQADPGDALTAGEYRSHALGARHMAPSGACERIRAAAKEAAESLPRLRGRPAPPFPEAPYVVEIAYRTDRRGEYRHVRHCHETSLAAALNMKA
jgi:D-aminopeptidase